MYGPLFKLIGREFEQNLGASYEVTEDGLAWVVSIASTATWMDGQPVTSEDVLFSIDLAEAAIPEIGPILQEYLDLEASTAVDEKTVSFVLRSPYADFALNVLTTVPIVPMHIWEPLRGTEAWLTHPAATGNPCDEAKPAIVGAGPYAFGWRETGIKVVLDAKAPYWTDAPNIARYVWVVYPTFAELCAAVGREVDDWMIPNVPGTEIEPCVARLPDSDYVVQETPTERLTFVGLNPVTIADGRVRQALLQSIDRDALVEQVLGGHGEAASGLVSSQSIAFDDASAQLYPFDPEMAVALLAQAGLADRDNDGFVDAPGRDLRIDLAYRAESAADAAAAAAIADQWSTIGLDVELLPLRGSDFVRAVYLDQNVAAFLDSYEGLPSWGLWGDRSALFSCGANAFGYCNPEYDAITQQSRQTLDPEQRLELARTAGAILNSKLPVLPLWFENRATIHSASLENFAANASGIAESLPVVSPVSG
jgi:peptide/nickel transport system substrate-binding protein